MTRNYSAKFKTLSNRELLEILDDENSYEIAAFESAKAELALREIDDSDKALFEEAKREREAREKRKQQITEKAEGFWEWLGNQLKAVIGPLPQEVTIAERRVKQLSVVGLFLAAYMLYSKMGLLRFLLFDDMQEFSMDFSIVSFITPLVLIVVAAFLFLFRQIFGWILCVAFLIVEAIGLVIHLLYLLVNDGLDMLVQARYDFYGLPDSMLIFAVLSLYLLVLWQLDRAEVRELFSVSDKMATGTILASFFVGTLSNLILYFSI